MSANTPTEYAALWSRIKAFSLDEAGASFPFTARLARENGWSAGYTRRVIEEYKRFLFLALTSGHPVTPSIDVDQAWHLHLIYTRSYWEDLCGRVLRRPLHHEPTKGGGAEAREFFTDRYNRTLRTYEHWFGHAPPRDIWPEASDRFSPRSRIQQVSDRTHWVIRKSGPRPSIAALLAILGILVVPSCAGEPGGGGDLVWITFVVGLAIAHLLLQGKSDDKSGSDDGSGGFVGCCGCE